MSSLKQQLIRLGNQKPSLRKHIKPVLRDIDNRRTSSCWYEDSSSRTSSFQKNSANERQVRKIQSGLHDVQEAILDEIPIADDYIKDKFKEHIDRLWDALDILKYDYLGYR